jgi:hypothetical protein
MNLTTEVELVQNTALGALSIWTFTNEFFGQCRQRRGPQLALATIVLPMVFHEDTLEAIHARHFEGGLFTALAQNRGIGVELQDRIEAMVPETMASLNLCFASGLLAFNKDKATLRPLRRSAPFSVQTESARHMVAAAARLGYWCSTINTARLCSLLSIRF